MITLRHVLLALSAVAFHVPGVQAQSGPTHDYWPGRERTVPHVTGDVNLTNTYNQWKDEDAVRRSKAKTNLPPCLRRERCSWGCRKNNGLGLVCPWCVC